jgi:2-polyprenyl-6-methoxyphenol hydroxylase-like FAD-dependent oxidoreductase
MKEAVIEVLIVGAGPTGLSLANLLARMGVSFLLIDKKEGPSRSSKAFAIHARSLEIFDQLGIAQQAIAQGSIDNTVHVYSRNQEKLRFRLHALLPGESPFPYFLVLAQNRTEQLLVEALQAQEQAIYWQHTLTALTQTSAGLKASIATPEGGMQQLQTRYLIGCDGAGSTVREQAGFHFRGKTFSPTFYLADAGLDWPFAHGDIYITLAPDHLSLIFSFQEKGRYRIFNFLNRGKGRHLNELDAATFQAILDTNSYLPKRIREADWFSVYKIHSRITSSFQQGNICLAGDAAHVHSPVGGQGMNTGIQDAYNLAWKLALLVQEHAPEELLKTYQEERHPIAKALHATTDRYFQLMVNESRAADFFRQHLFPRLLGLVVGLSRLRKALFMRFSQLGIHYRFSSLSHDPDPAGFPPSAPRPGDRAPWLRLGHGEDSISFFSLFGPAHFCVLLCSWQPQQQGVVDIQAYFARHPSAWVRLEMLRAARHKAFCKRYGIRGNAVFIIRPDGHIGYRSAAPSVEGVRGYLSCFLGEV